MLDKTKANKDEIEQMYKTYCVGVDVAREILGDDMSRSTGLETNLKFKPLFYKKPAQDCLSELIGAPLNANNETQVLVKLIYQLGLRAENNK